MENLNQHLPEGLLDKLNKLKNLEEGAKSVGSYEESSNAAAKFQALLLKHNLTEEEVLQHGIQKKAQMLHQEIDLNPLQSKTEANWVLKLLNAVAHYSMCVVVHRQTFRKTGDQGYAAVLGEKQNVAMVFYITEQLISKINIASKEAFKRYQGAEKRNTFKRGFLIGAVAAIRNRLDKQEKEILSQAKNTTKESDGGITVKTDKLGIMLINKRALAERFTTDKFPKLKCIKQRVNLSGEDGKREGYESGSKMPINQGMEGSKPKGHLKN